jgi:hypothetical protein
MKTTAHFDGMAWPMPVDDPEHTLEWSLRYSTPTRTELLRAASIVAAYRELIECTEAKRRSVVRKIRRAVNESVSRFSTKETSDGRAED